jgi:hypothetical protein
MYVVVAALGLVAAALAVAALVQIVAALRLGFLVIMSPAWAAFATAIVLLVTATIVALIAVLLLRSRPRGGLGMPMVGLLGSLVRRNPLASLGFALGAGLVAEWQTRRRRPPPKL